MANKTYLKIAACLFAAAPLTAGAFSLSDEFQNMASSSGGMSNTVSPSEFRADAMRGYDFGGVSIRVPVKKINLVSVERASLNAGCHGVDIRFGGMAFISASEIVEQLKLIAKGAPALIYNMTLQAIAAPLVSALNNLYDTMAKLSASLKNSCEASMALVNATHNLASDNIKGYDTAIGGIASWQGKTFDGAIESAWNKYRNSDNEQDNKVKQDARLSECLMTYLSLGMISSMDADTACGKEKATKKTADELEDAITNLKNKAGWDETAARAYLGADQKGNKTWNALQLYGAAPANPDGGVPAGAFLPNYRIAVLLQSLLGTEIVPREGEEAMVAANLKGAAGDSESKVSVGIPAQPTLTGEQFLTLFVCGSESFVRTYTPPADNPNYTASLDFCKGKMGLATPDSPAGSLVEGLTVIACQNMTTSRNWMTGCIDAKPMSMRDFETISLVSPNTEKGMLFMVLDLMYSAVDKAAIGAPSGFEANERALIHMAPFPLYEVINVAAASPSLSKALIHANAQILAFHFAEASIQSIFKSIHHSDVFHQRAGLGSTAILDAFIAAQKNLQSASAVEIERVTLYKNTVDVMMQHVKTINSDILKSTMAMGINGTEFAESMSTLVNR